MPDPNLDVKPTGQVQDPKPTPDGVKPPADGSQPGDVKLPGSPSPDVKLDGGQDGAKTDPALLLKSLQEERDKRRAAEARNEQFRNVVGDKIQFDASGNPIAAEAPQTDMQQKLNELWETDPRKAVQTEMMMGFQWYDKVNSSLDLQRSSCRTKYSDFNTYENQALQYVRTLPLEQRAKDGVIELAYLVQKGQNSDSIYKQAQDDIIRKLRAGESIQGIGATQPQSITPEGKQPTADEAKVAEAMGIPLAEYAKYRK